MRKSNQDKGTRVVFLVVIGVIAIACVLGLILFWTTELRWARPLLPVTVTPKSNVPKEKDWYDLPSKVCADYLDGSSSVATVPIGGKTLQFVLLLDGSLSMRSHRDYAMHVLNQFWNEIQDGARQAAVYKEMLFSMVHANSEDKTNWIQKDVAAYRVRSFALEEGLFRGESILIESISNMIHRYRHMRHVIMAIVSDGSIQLRSSSKSKQQKQQLHSLVTCYQAKSNWSFHYFGLGKNSHSFGVELGIRPSTVYDLNVHEDL